MLKYLIIIIISFRVTACCVCVGAFCCERVLSVTSQSY